MKKGRFSKEFLQKTHHIYSSIRKRVGNGGPISWTAQKSTKVKIKYTSKKILIFCFLCSIVIDSLDPADYKAYCGAFK